MENIPDPSDKSTRKDWWTRVSKSFILSPDISPKAKTLWITIHAHGKTPTIGQDKLMLAIGVSKWVTLTKYLKEIKRLVPGWGWKQPILGKNR